MTLRDDIISNSRNIFKGQWTTRRGNVVPVPEDLKLSNDAVELAQATILYADLNGSTSLVDNSAWTFSAEIYKAYLFAAAKIIRSEGGAITSYDGDRVMGIFIGEGQFASAVRAGMKINYAVAAIINAELLKQYPSSNYAVKQVVGIDTSPIRAARTGVRGGNDLVWVGRAANYAAKLTAIDGERALWITEDVYTRLGDQQKFSSGERKHMWTKFNWKAHGGLPIYGTSWSWQL